MYNDQRKRIGILYSVHTRYIYAALLYGIGKEDIIRSERVQSCRWYARASMVCVRSLFALVLVLDVFSVLVFCLRSSIDRQVWVSW